MGKDGKVPKTGKSDWAAQYAAVEAWAEAEKTKGMTPNGEDLLGEFTDMLMEELEDLQNVEAEQLSADETARKAALEKKLEVLQKADNRRGQRNKLLGMCGIRENAPSNVMPLEQKEADLLVKLGWQSWDYTVEALISQSEERLQWLFHDAEKVAREVASVRLVFSDAVPIYMHPSTGKVSVSAEVLRSKAERLKARRKGEPPPALPAEVTLNLEAEGGSRREKDRLTWIARQAIDGAFDPELSAKGELPKSKILDSILIVPCTQPVRLEDIGADGKWLRTHTAKRLQH